MANLLDRASIVLTPTAYNNGEALCIKPDDGSGDFQFSRNSAATRVNAQGLVENVQILSSNLVQNGDFSEEGAEEVSNGSFSQEGVQLITNGSFDTDSDWTKGTGWSISGGSANCDGVSSNSSLYQNVGGVNNTIYKITGTISNYVSGTLQVGGSSNFLAVNSNGDFVHYRQWTSDSTLYLKSVNFIGSIDNVSCVEVGQDWTLGTGWSIGEDKAISDGTTSNLDQFSTSIIGKSYKVALTVNNITTGALSVRLGSTSSSEVINITSNGTYIAYGVAETTYLRLRSQSGFDGSVTNISVKEVGQNWDLGTGWSIGEDKAVAVSGSATKLQQTISGLSGKKCSVTFTLSDYQGTDLVLLDFGSTSGQSITANGTYTEIGTYDQNYFQLYKGANFSGNITNISVIEITDDTNLPRINYEGFSYQDALGSELVVNGDFSNGTTGWAFAEGWSVVNNQATTLGVSLTPIRQTVLVNGTNRLTFDVVEGGALVYTNYPIFSIKATFSTVGTHTIDLLSDGVGDNRFLYIYNNGAGNSATIDNVSVKEVLGQEVVPDSGCGSWLWEPQSSNLLTQSELFSDASWAKLGNSSFGFVTGIAPNGATSVYEITSDGGGGKLQYTISGLAINTEYTLSFYAKKESDITLVQSRILSLTGGSGGTNLTTVNYQNDLITDQWVRITHTFTTNDTLGNYILYISNALTSGDTLQLWGAQVEALSYATSYIPTSGSTVTRNQDVCTNGGSLASINSTEGVLYAEIAALSDSGNCQFGLFGNSTSQQLRLEISNSIIRAQLFNGAYQANMSSTQVVTNNNKIAFKYKENDFALWVNGVEVATDNSGVTFNANELIKFNLTAQNNISTPFFGKTKCLAVWKEALSDEELTELTTI